MSAVDHAADARKNLTFASEALQDEDVEAAQAILSLAQAQATLALFEQQRIANLIALSQATNPDGSRFAPGALTHPVDEYSVAINDDIKTGLGLS